MILEQYFEEQRRAAFVSDPSVHKNVYQPLKFHRPMHANGWERFTLADTYPWFKDLRSKFFYDIQRCCLIFPTMNAVLKLLIQCHLVPPWIAVNVLCNHRSRTSKALSLFLSLWGGSVLPSEGGLGQRKNGFKSFFPAFGVLGDSLGWPVFYLIRQPL